MSIPFPQPQLVQPVSSNAPSLIQFPTSTTGHLLPPSPNPGHHRNPHHHGHSRSSSLAPSPAPSPVHIPSSGPAPISQGHHFRPRTHSHSSDHHHHHHHHSQSSHGHSRSHSGHGSRSVTPTPPLLVSQNSEPIAPYMMMPGASYTASGYQPQYAAQPGHGHAFAPPVASVPMPVQPRALRVSQISRSRDRKPLLSQEVDAPDPPRRDWRSHPLFRHSRCTGRRKALCVGVNYTGQKNELHGCVNDAKNIYQFLMEHHRYPHSNIIVLTDDNPDPRLQPTRMNMLNSMRWLVEDARPDDALFIHYSGHGGRTRDQDGDETDGWDDVIFPVDYKTAGIISDDVLNETLVRPLPPGCRLTAVFDSCHSGSILDLVFEFHSNGRLKSSPVSQAFQQKKSTPGDVICFSGSKDSQTSADVVQGGVAVGAMSYAFLKVLKRNPQITYIDLLRGVREILNKKYSQKPQLSASHKIDSNLHFIM